MLEDLRCPFRRKKYRWYRRSAGRSARSAEHQAALQHLHQADLQGQVVAVLRQEVDSLVRVIYLLSVSDRDLRMQLLRDSVEGREWRHPSTGKRITDRQMIDLADGLTGWTRSVYRFGCAFIHLSAFHDYRDRDPMRMISAKEREALLAHMRYYHGGPHGANPTFGDVVVYLPWVFDKIARNLEQYLKELEADSDLKP